MDLKEKRIVVTGSNGFLGTHVGNRLKEIGCEGNVFGVRSAQYDLTTKQGVTEMYDTLRPDIVIHLAAVVGGIGINREKPGTFFYKNLIMGTFLIEEARLRNIDKFIAIGTVCAYPKETEVPFKEDDLWEGYPEETNAPYGLAKKMMLVQLQAYRDEFGFNGIYLLPVNLYGPNDNFDPRSSHVIPALIKKCIDARNCGAKSMQVWGDGQATREFLYVKDAARGIVSAAENYQGKEPVNLGTGSEIKIRDLITLIAKETDYTGEIVWDKSKPNGQMKRRLDTTRAEKEFGFKAEMKLEEGIRATISWYENQCESK